MDKYRVTILHGCHSQMWARRGNIFVDVKYGWAPSKMSQLEREMVPKIAPYILDVRYDISIGPVV